MRREVVGQDPLELELVGLHIKIKASAIGTASSGFVILGRLKGSPRDEALAKRP